MRERTIMRRTVRSPRRATILRALSICVWSAAAFGCDNPQANQAMQPPPPEVAVLAVHLQDVPVEDEWIGQTESVRPVEIRSQVTGLLKERYFQEGRDVKKGDKLYQIDPVPFRAALLSAKAKVAEAAARVVQAQRTLARYQPLLQKKAVSHKDVDDALAEDLAAKAGLEAAQADLVKVQFDMDNTVIVAPIDGRIERTKVYEGRLVAAQTDLLTVVHQLDPMYVTASAPETFVLKRLRERAMKRVQGAEMHELRGTITFTDGSRYPHEGTFDLLDVTLREETGTRDFRVVFPNPEKTLFPGQFVTLRIRGEMRTGIAVVPQRAVQQGPKGSVVFVVGADDKVEVRGVQATGWKGNQWLVESGLREGERIVVEGLHLLAPGAPVRPVPAGAASAPSAPGQAGAVPGPHS